MLLKKIYIKRSGFIIAFAVTICSFVPVYAQPSNAYNTPSELKFFPTNLVPSLVPDENQIRAGLLYDLERGTIIWEKDMDYAWPIASLTKMMVGLLAIEDIEAGKVNMSDVISVQNTYKKKIRRKRYKSYTVIERYAFSDLLKMAMIRSHNESTVWIAKHCSGTVEAFIDRMNQKTVELGMTRTFYNNTSGLPAPGALVDNSSSPRDLLLLALECIKHKQLLDITAIPYVTVNNGICNINYHNHNGLTINYQGEVDGIKTGYTKAAGFCMVATSGRAEHRMISIVLGAKSPWIRNNIVAGMINSYYDAIRLGRMGEVVPDLQASKLFMDSLSNGLASITPNVEPKHTDSSDASFAYTYKTEVTQIKKSFIVRPGDNLSIVASRAKTTVAELKKWNKLKSDRLMKGQQLFSWITVKKKIPIKLEVVPDEDVAENDSCVDNNLTANNGPQLKDKDNNGHPIAEKTKVQFDSFKKETKNKSTETVKANPNISKIVFHTVQQGDTLWNIAQRYRTTIQNIKRVNRISGNQIKVGSRLKVPLNS